MTSMAIGCLPVSPTKTTCPVHGTVTLDGKPLMEGEIYFKTNATGELDVLPIQQGQFAGQAAKGHRRVEIFAYRETQVVPMPGMAPETTRENYLPPQYNFNSSLTANLLADEPNELHFALTSK